MPPKKRYNNKFKHPLGIYGVNAYERMRKIVNVLSGYQLGYWPFIRKMAVFNYNNKLPKSCVHIDKTGELYVLLDAADVGKGRILEYVKYYACDKNTKYVSDIITRDDVKYCEDVLANGIGHPLSPFDEELMQTYLDDFEKAQQEMYVFAEKSKFVSQYDGSLVPLNDADRLNVSIFEERISIILSKILDLEKLCD